MIRPSSVPAPTPRSAAEGRDDQDVARPDHDPRQDVAAEPVGAEQVLRPGRLMALGEVVERVVRRDPFAEDGGDDPAEDDQAADDEGGPPEQDAQGLAAGLGSLRGGTGCARGHRGDGRERAGRDRDVHQRSASSRIRGFIQAMIRSAISVASMYTMPTMITPAVSIGMSLRWAENSIVWPIPG